YGVLYHVAFVLAGLLMIPFWQLGREQALASWLAVGFFVGWLVMARMTRAWPFRLDRGHHPHGRPGKRFRPRRGAPPPHRWRMRGVALLCGGLVVLVLPAPPPWW